VDGFQGQVAVPVLRTVAVAITNMPGDLLSKANATGMPRPSLSSTVQSDARTWSGRSLVYGYLLKKLTWERKNYTARLWTQRARIGLSHWLHIVIKEK
jgi:hypothetical protein